MTIYVDGQHFNVSWAWKDSFVVMKRLRLGHPNNELWIKKVYKMTIRRNLYQRKKKCVVTPSNC